MCASATSKTTSTTTGAYIRVHPSICTLKSPINYVLGSASIAVPTSVVVAEAKAIIREAQTDYPQAITLPEIGFDYNAEEELEWNAFFAQPDIQAELERLAEEAEQEFAAGKTEEGGFAIV